MYAFGIQIRPTLSGDHFGAAISSSEEDSLDDISDSLVDRFDGEMGVAVIAIGGFKLKFKGKYA